MFCGNPMCVLSHCSRVRLSVTLWTLAHQAPLSMGFSRQEYCRGLPWTPPGDLPDPGIEFGSLKCPALAGGLFTTSATWEALAAGKPGGWGKTGAGSLQKAFSQAPFTWRGVPHTGQWEAGDPDSPALLRRKFGLLLSALHPALKLSLQGSQSRERQRLYRGPAHSWVGGGGLEGQMGRAVRGKTAANWSRVRPNSSQVLLK